MALVRMTLEEGLAKGYKLAEVPEPRRIAPPTTGETIGMVAREVLPTIGLAIVGGVPGAAVGGAIGNTWSQKYRQSIGLQDDFSVAELGTATAASAIPFGPLAKGAHWAKGAALRGTQGAMVATAELGARVGLERGELPTFDEMSMTVLFGGAFGGTLGAAEAKYLRQALDTPSIEANDTRPQVMDKVTDEIRARRGTQSEFPFITDDVGKPLDARSTAQQMVVNAEIPVAQRASAALDEGIIDQDMADMLARTRMEEPVAATQRSPDFLNGSPKLKSQYKANAERLEKLNKEIHSATSMKKAAALTKELNELVEKQNAIRKEATELPPKLAKKVEEAQKKVTRAKKKPTLKKLDSKIKKLEKSIKEHPEEQDVFDVREIELEFAKEDARVLRRDAPEAKATVGAIRKAKEVGVDIAEVTGTGAKGRVTIKDVLAHRAASAPRDTAAGGIAKPATEAGDVKPKRVTFKNINEAVRPLGFKLWRGKHRGESEFVFKPIDELDVDSPHLEDARVYTTKLTDYSIEGWVDDLVGRIEETLEVEKLRITPNANVITNLEKTLARASTAKPAREAPVKEQTAVAPAEVPSLTEINVNDWIGKTLDDPSFDYLSMLESGEDFTAPGLMLEKEGGEFIVVDKSEGSFETISKADAKVMIREHLKRRSGKKSLEPEQGAPSKLKQTAVPSLIAAGGGIAVMTQDEKDALSSSASIGEFILWMAAMGVSWKVAKRILRTPEGKLLKNNTDVRRKAMDEANVRDNGDTFSEGKVVDVASDEQKYRDARWTESRWDDIKKITRHALEPMSRTLKKIDPVLNKLFQNLGFETNRTIGRYLERMTFAKAMTLAIRGNNPLKPQNDLDWRLFRKSLRNKSYRTYLPEELEGSREGYLMVGDGTLAKKSDYDSAQVAERDLQGLMQKYNPQVLAYMRKKHKGDRHKRDRGAAFLYNEYNVAIKELRGWARSKGGLPIGELENYFPSGLKDWERFRNFMSKHEGWDELENEIIREIDKVEMKWNTPATREEQSEIASAYLRRKVESGTMPSHLKHRVLDSIEDNVVDAYHEPTAITESYVRKMVTSTLTREFLGVPKEPLIRKHVVDIPEHLGETRDVVPMSDLGLDFDLDGAVSDYLAKNKFAERFGREEVEKIREVMQARFSARGYGGLVGDAKNLTYISVLGNFGATITQLGDQAFSFHFNGLGPTFRAWFDKTLPDFYTQFGLNSADIDLTNSRDGLSKLLNMALTATGFNALDKFGKNTVMKGAFVRMQNLAKNNPSKLLNELEPRHGKAGANQIRNDLLSDNPFTDAVEGEIFAKLLEVQPAAASEMTITQTRAMNLPPVAREVVSSAYWLKTFTIKQWDTFLYQSNGKISKAHELWKKGDKNGAVKSAAEGLKGLTMLAAWFGAMNAGTSVIKDTIYGRKTNLDELKTDMAFRLMGISRYNVWRARREGTLKSAVEFFMPGTTAIDRAEKDLRAIFSGETPPAETIRGIGVGDFYYWHYGGGREKTRKEIAKQYGLKLEYVPK